MQTVAVVGTGIAGMGIAAFLQPFFRLTVFEKADYVGGHTNTVNVDEDGVSIPIDTGFMVFNKVTYPLLCRLFERLNVPIKKTTMSFSVRHSPSGLEYCGSGLNGLFRQRKNLLSLPFIKMLLSINRFNTDALEILGDARYERITIAELVEARGYGKDFFDKYLVPMSAAVWSTPPDLMAQFPAQTLIRFFHNHGFLGLNTQHQWYTVVGGSETYKQKLIAPFKDRIRLSQRIKHIRRLNPGFVLVHEDGREEIFDKVILACHADEALALLEKPTEEERRLLSRFAYQRNEILLHSDSRVMPQIRDVWSSWNYRIEVDGRGRSHPSTIYWMNELQGCSQKKNYFISLNDPALIDEKHVLKSITYHHPLFDRGAVQAQRELPRLNRSGSGMYFCGSYFRYGFHEDAFGSAADLAQEILGRDPW